MRSAILANEIIGGKKKKEIIGGYLSDTYKGFEKIFNLLINV